MIIYTNPCSTPGIQQECTSLEYATARDFPRHLHRKREVQIQACSGHKGNCARLSCIWMHFSLLRDGNNTSSPSSAFIHILLHFLFFLQFHEGNFENIWNFLKKKIKEIKRKLKESENFHFKFLSLCLPKLSSPTHIFVQVWNYRLPTRFPSVLTLASNIFEWLHSLHVRVENKHYKPHPKPHGPRVPSLELYFSFKWPNKFLALVYKEAAFHAFTFTQIYKKSKTTAFWMLIPNPHALGNPTRAQAGGHTRARD